jgi:hypothetical protein
VTLLAGPHLALGVVEWRHRNVLLSTMLHRPTLDGGRGAALQVLLAAPRAAYERGALDTLQRVVPVAELPCASATAQGGAAAPHVLWSDVVLKLRDCNLQVQAQQPTADYMVEATI